MSIDRLGELRHNLFVDRHNQPDPLKQRALNALYHMTGLLLLDAINDQETRQAILRERGVSDE